MRRIAALFALAVLVASVFVPAAAARDLAGLDRAQTPAPTGRIILQFSESSGLAMGLAGIEPASPAALRTAAHIAAVAPGFRLVRHFSRTPDQIRSERAVAEALSGETLPDLNRYARLEPVRPMSRPELLGILRALLQDPAVGTAFLEPVAVPAALGFDAFTGNFAPPAGRTDSEPAAPVMPGSALANGPGLPTPDFTGMQGYLDPAPTGVDAEGVWGFPGGRGQTVRVLDIEGAWLWTHEDLTQPFYTAGGQIDDAGWRNHGTAVMGEMRGTVNTFGITGIANELQVGGVSIATLSTADAINTAAANIGLGDLFLIELHAPGPNANGSGQFGYVCMEYWQDNFDAIRIACANGRICCEAAGNGEQNLDDPIYQGLFDRNVRDSGAIMCGATDGSSLNPAWFTNYGNRVDLHGWGYSVVTSGYGDLQGGAETQWYTAGFSGTSSASPIVTGSVASLQGLSKAGLGRPLTARVARDILVATGTPQNGTHHIGPRPNLTAARTLLQTAGAVTGIVTDSQSGLPVAGVDVKVVESGAFARTGADGSYYVGLLAGSYTLQFSSFFHQAFQTTITITAGQTTTRDVTLVLRELVTVTGTVLSNNGTGALAGIRVTPLAVPITGTVTGGDGTWSIPGVPAGRTYNFSFDNLPNWGADFAARAVGGGTPVPTPFEVQIPPATQNFESGPGSYVGDAGVWTYGHPAGNGGPSNGFSGAYCWGVGMAGSGYSDYMHGYLTSPAYNFSGATRLRLSFHYWCATESGFDGVNVQVWTGGQWHTVTPMAGYNSISLGGINYENGWSGTTNGWVGAVFDFGPYISGAVKFRLQFGADSGVTGPGFWMDDVAFDTGDTPVAVESPVLIPTFTVDSRPNPARSSARIALVSPVAGAVDLAVYSVSGRRIATLHTGPVSAGRREFVWDGTDGAGHVVADGVYFVRAQSGSETRTARVVIAR